MRSLGLLINQGILRQCGITLINVYVFYYPYFISSSYTMALFNHHKNYLHYLFFCFHSLFIYTFQVPSNIAQKVTSAYHHILFITFKFPRNYIITKKPWQNHWWWNTDSWTILWRWFFTEIAMISQWFF